jgi:hypothetical protein
MDTIIIKSSYEALPPLIKKDVLFEFYEKIYNYLQDNKIVGQNDYHWTIFFPFHLGIAFGSLGGSAVSLEAFALTC